MRFAVVSYHLPHPDGTATGRHVYAVWDAVRAMGHDVEAWCWGDAPAGLLPPEWVTVRPVRDQRSKLATLRRPRWSLATVGWRPPAEAVGWAEEPESYAAVATAGQRGTTTYHSELLDALALRRLHPAVVQSMRAERRAIRGADVAVTFSARVARAVGVPHCCPVTQPIPAEPLPVVAEPVAVLLANWGWPPNRRAVQRLLAQWPLVRSRVPDARLLLAGRGPMPATDLPGVEVVGEVARTVDVLRRGAVMAFPCPPTSGPKMKVLDALAHGVPVVTTAAGVEGIGADRSGDLPGAAVASGRDFAGVLADMLMDESRRARMAAGGRQLVLDHHTPQRAAETRLALLGGAQPTAPAHNRDI